MSPRAAGNLAVRFWSRVVRGPGCWLWMGTTDTCGYGRLVVGSRTDGTRRLAGAHRIAYALAAGPIPAGGQVLHRCDTPACVRPDHLFLGTQADNIADMVSKGRQRGGSLRGEKNPTAKLTWAKVTEIRRLYANGGVSQRALGEMFGVEQTSVGFVVRGETWREVAGA